MEDPQNIETYPNLEKCSFEDAIGFNMQSTIDSIINTGSKSFVLFVIGGLSFSEIFTLKKIAKIYKKKLLIVTTNLMNKQYLKNFINQN